MNTIAETSAGERAPPTSRPTRCGSTPRPRPRAIADGDPRPGAAPAAPPRRRRRAVRRHRFQRHRGAVRARRSGPTTCWRVLMPEKDSDPDSLRLGRLVAETFGIRHVVEDIAPIARRPPAATSGATASSAASFRTSAPAGAARSCIANALQATATTSPRSSCSRRTASSAEARMPLDVYLGIVAATNMKQRTRKQIEYYHADRLNYAVVGTPNRLEYDQGFFVKNGDGAADVKPIAHLYKTQVYQLAEHLGVPDGDPRAAADHRHLVAGADAGGVLLLAALRAQMDLCLYGLDNGVAGRGRGAGRRPDAGAGRAGLARHRGQAPRDPLSARAAAAGRGRAAGGRRCRPSARRNASGRGDGFGVIRFPFDRLGTAPAGAALSDPGRACACPGAGSCGRGKKRPS